MKQFDVLVVEDDLALSEALCTTLEIEGYQVASATNGTEALVKLSKNHFKLVVSDVQMPVMDGFQLLHNILQSYAQTPVLLMTAHGSIPKAVTAIQTGAADYLVKPFDADTLVTKVADLICSKPVAANDQSIQDASMQKLYSLIDKVAKTKVTVLLQGESGTGKEVIAQYIHQHSNYCDGPFIAVNCAAIPENMLEAMLFGYEKGAFTGATQSVAGKFEQAQRGTLLLDEVSEMDLALQAKLLRVLQERELERLGSNQKISLNVRILATTNRKLKNYVNQGLFREDLYYRLNVFPIKIPALRERQGDILPLATDLLQRHAGKAKAIPKIDPSAQLKLLSYQWPGNVRELENVMQRALILQTQGTIGQQDLVFEDEIEHKLHVEADLNNGQQTISDVVQQYPACLGDGVRSAEEKIILQTLQEESGSRKITAEKLGISPRTLRYKIARMKESGVPVPC